MPRSSDSGAVFELIGGVCYCIVLYCPFRLSFFF
jgi:hypothetical protein